MRRTTSTLLCMLMMIAAASPQAILPVTRVLVYKRDHKMVLMSGQKQLRTYKVALGDPVGRKQQQGDHRTPEGIYTLDFRNDHSTFYKAFHVSYPNAQDKLEARKMGVNPGGDIMLHGLPKQYAWVGKQHLLHDWTDGCIAVTNDEMDELWRSVPVGTPIEIRP